MRRREADRKQKRQKRTATRGAYRVTNQQRMAARRALEWIRTSKAWLVFRYEISDLFNQQKIVLASLIIVFRIS